VKVLGVAWAGPAGWPLVAAIVLAVNAAGLLAAAGLVPGFDLHGKMGRFGAPALMSVTDVVFRQIAISFVQAASQA
jgi:hypothetical protein